MIGQLRHLFVQIAANPNRKISEFQFLVDAGDPLPAFVPRANSTAPASNHAPSVMQNRANTGGMVVKKILSRVYTHLGKI
jgi:hypothetical protein